MNPDEFLEWVQEQISFAEGWRNYHPNTKEENKFWDGKIAAFNEVLEKCLTTRA